MARDGLEALFGAALDNRVRTVLLDRTLTDFGSLVASEDYNLKVASFRLRAASAL